MTERLTICVECENFRNLEPGSVRKDCWYNHLCLASPLPKKLNVVTGKMKTRSPHDYAYCREVNIDGHCPKFSEKRGGERNERV